MQLLIIDNAVSKDFKIDNSELVFPVLIVDPRDNSMKVANEDGSISCVGLGDIKFNLVEYAHRKRFGIVTNNVVDDNTLAIDSILTADEIKSMTQIDNPIKYNN